MQQSVPARITIELLPPDAVSDGWTARTTVGSPDPGSSTSDARGAELASSSVIAGAPRLEQQTPAGYEASSCTCHDGWCGCDHDND